MYLYILHASGFSWDEAVVLVVAILAVPVLSWFTGRFGKRMQATSRDEERRARRKRVRESSSEDSGEA